MSSAISYPSTAFSTLNLSSPSSVPDVMSNLTSDNLFNRLDLARLAKRLVSEDGLKDIEFAHEAILEYKRFFFMLAESEEIPCRRYLPSSIVDLVWQRHMLDTFNYFEDCDRFDMPGGYCHRHELYSAGNDPDPDPEAVAAAATAAEMCPSPLDHSTQSHYMSTLKEYENMYGRRPREDIWPRVYDYVAQHEKRKIKIKRSAAAVEEKCLSYAIPHAAVRVSKPPLIVDVETYVLPGELDIMKNVMWVGELVYNTLPLKQLKCVKGEVITQISLEPHGPATVENVVREYARFLLLVLGRARDDMIGRLHGELHGQKAEITPSKLVDELWHAHILCSPAYFLFW
jgi:hypothetical protein